MKAVDVGVTCTHHGRPGWGDPVTLGTWPTAPFEEAPSSSDGERRRWIDVGRTESRPLTPEELRLAWDCRPKQVGAHWRNHLATALQLECVCGTTKRISATALVDTLRRAAVLGVPQVPLSMFR